MNPFDVAPTYGSAEERMGPALEAYRKTILLSSKTTPRQRATAVSELDRSLARLRTDPVDLYPLHGVTRLEEVETIFGEDAAIHALENAKQDGKARFLGFSAHSVEAALALIDRFAFDPILLLPSHVLTAARAAASSR